jgi:hypothetical protein
MAKGTIQEEMQRQKREFWRRHIEQWSRSGSTQAEYCRRHKLSTKSFTYWKGRFRELSILNMTTRQKEPVRFVPVEVRPEAELAADNSPGLVLHRDGYRIEIREGFNPAVLGKVLRTIQELTC